MATPQFKRIVKTLKDEEPLVRAVMQIQSKGKFKPFSIEVTPATARPYDGKFHPSTHSTWALRQLYLYLTAPESIEVETLSSGSIFAITRGHFWHEYLQTMIAQTGLLTEAEVPFNDTVFNRTGHMDGRLLIDGKVEGLEIKTINARSLTKINDAESLYEHKFPYWAQAQEYLDVFQLDTMRFLFINPEYPFQMKEFKVYADEDHQIRRRKLYAEAQELAAEHPGPLTLTTDIPACCKPKSATASSCPVRTSCPIGRM